LLKSKAAYDDDLRNDPHIYELNRQEITKLLGFDPKSSLAEFIPTCCSIAPIDAELLEQCEKVVLSCDTAVDELMILKREYDAGSKSRISCRLIKAHLLRGDKLAAVATINAEMCIMLSCTELYVHDMGQQGGRRYVNRLREALEQEPNNLFYLQLLRDLLIAQGDKENLKKVMFQRAVVSLQYADKAHLEYVRCGIGHAEEEGHRAYTHDEHQAWLF
jgi:hypothetical protein